MEKLLKGLEERWNKMNLSKKRVYDALNKAERVFKNPPEEGLNNRDGLCHYLELEGFTEKEIDYILKKKNAGKYYMFCNGKPQSEIYRVGLSHIYHVRSDWCAKRKLDFVKE